MLSTSLREEDSFIFGSSWTLQRMQQSNFFSITHKHTHTHPHTHHYTPTHTHTHIYTLFHIRAHTHTHTHKHIQSHSHAPNIQPTFVNLPPCTRISRTSSIALEQWCRIMGENNLPTFSIFFLFLFQTLF